MLIFCNSKLLDILVGLFVDFRKTRNEMQQIMQTIFS